jgi:signal transduction histidine kinase
MTRAAHALGAGDFAIEPRPAAIYEAAEAGRALQATARRLGALLEQARSAAADASHQVRTPLTALRLGLERVLLTPDADRDTAIREALQRAERVEATVAEVLTRSRDPLAPVEPIDVGAVMVAARAGRWGELARARRRTLDLVIEPGLPAAAATTGRARPGARRAGQQRPRARRGTGHRQRPHGRRRGGGRRSRRGRRVRPGRARRRVPAAATRAPAATGSAWPWPATWPSRSAPG